jgi:cytochrome b subunit of formate dehydrogenase
VSRSRQAAAERRGVLLKVLYWVAVVAISLALVVGLVLFLESRDQSSVESDSALPARLT